MTLSEKLKRFTPIVCRLLARKTPKRGSNSIDMSDEEIAAAANLPLSEIKALQWRKTWDGVPVSVWLAYSRACGVDFESQRAVKRNRELLAHGAARHLLKSPRWEQQYKPLYEYLNRLTVKLG